MLGCTATTGRSRATPQRPGGWWLLQMRSLAISEQEPLAVDLRLDASVTLPDQVAREVERAALALTRLTADPYGTTAWRAYYQRFYERYGIGSLVPVREAD